MKTRWHNSFGNRNAMKFVGPISESSQKVASTVSGSKSPCMKKWMAQADLPKEAITLEGIYGRP